MELIKVINNVSERVVDDLKTKLSKGSRVSIAAVSFSIYAFEALKEELENVDELRFIFTSPTFIKDKVKKEKLFSDYSKVYEFVHNLNWTHIRRLLSVVNPEARMWYLKNASEEMWSTTTLDRNISSQYFERRLAAQRANPDMKMTEAVAPYNDSDPLEYIKNPMIAEFMGFRKDTKFDESQLEQALIDNLQQFILELGRGFAFVDRQKHIKTETGDYYIDLVFYNFRIKRFVLFELKTHTLTHQDVGQLDMYVRMYDDLVKGEDDNPTIGILLCAETDKTIAKYSVLHESEQLFAAKYMAFMPTEEELQCEIEKQKRFFLSQHGNNEE